MKKNNDWVKKTALKSKKNKVIVVKPKRNTLSHMLRTNKRMRPVVVALGSSLLIGITFGFIFLMMVKQEEPQYANILHSNTNEVRTIGDHGGEGSGIQVDSFPVYVVQGGVFSEDANAKKWGEKFMEASFPFITWERDGQYFVFAGVSSTEERAKSIASEMDKHDLEVYVKQWEIDAKSGNLSENDVQFLQLFVQVWTDSLKSVESTGMIETAKWNELQSMEGLSEQITSFQKMIEDSVNEMDKNSQTSHLLLQLIYEYEKLS